MQGEPTTENREQQADIQSIGNPGGAIDKAIEPARNKLSAAMSTVQEQSSRMVSGVQGYVQEAPMQSLAMAMGIGIIIGLLLGDAGYAPWRRSRSIL